jgi:hypothetical protein
VSAAGHPVRAPLLTIADSVMRLTLRPAARSLEVSSAENAAPSGEHKQTPWERVMMLNASTGGRFFGLDRVDWIMLRIHIRHSLAASPIPYLFAPIVLFL